MNKDFSNKNNLNKNLKNNLNKNLKNNLKEEDCYVECDHVLNSPSTNPISNGSVNSEGGFEVSSKISNDNNYKTTVRDSEPSNENFENDYEDSETLINDKKVDDSEDSETLISEHEQDESLELSYEQVDFPDDVSDLDDPSKFYYRREENGSGFWYKSNDSLNIISIIGSTIGLFFSSLFSSCIDCIGSFINRLKPSIKKIVLTKAFAISSILAFLIGGGLFYVIHFDMLDEFIANSNKSKLYSLDSYCVDLDFITLVTGEEFNKIKYTVDENNALLSNYSVYYVNNGKVKKSSLAEFYYNVFSSNIPLDDSLNDSLNDSLEGEEEEDVDNSNQSSLIVSNGISDGISDGIDENGSEESTSEDVDVESQIYPSKVPSKISYHLNKLFGVLVYSIELDETIEPSNGELGESGESGESTGLSDDGFVYIVSDILDVRYSKVEEGLLLEFSIKEPSKEPSNLSIMSDGSSVIGDSVSLDAKYSVPLNTDYYQIVVPRNFPMDEFIKPFEVFR